MFSGVKKNASACWRPVRRYARMNKDNDDDDSTHHARNDENSGSNSGVRTTISSDHPLLWSRDLEKHFLGEFSFAVYQANDVIEDHSQVEIGRNATFVGVYDGHGGPEAARFISDHLFLHLISQFLFFIFSLCFM
ncbi:unnamed protein product [Amaranthus hypochondriacus]